MAITIDIQGNVNLDTSNAKNQIHSLAESLQHNNISDESLLSQFSSTNKKENIYSNINNATELEDNFDNTKDKTNEILDEIKDEISKKKFEINPTKNPEFEENKSKKVLSYKEINNNINQAEKNAKELISGNFFEVAKGSVKSVGNNLQHTAEVLSNNEDMPGGMAGLIGKAGLVLSIAGAVGGAVKTGFDKVVNEYEANLPSIEDFYRNYGGDISSNTRVENKLAARSMFSDGIQAAHGTGLSNAEFIDAASNYAQYGVKDYTAAIQNTRSAANFAGITGIDISEIQKLQGLNYRYSGINGSKTVDQIYETAGKAGITIDEIQKYMPDFIHNISAAMESGIDKGFSRSLEDVSGTLGFISGLSDDEAWKKNTGKIYNSMSSGLENTIDLSTSSDLIAYQATARLSDSAYDVLGNDKTDNNYLNRAMLLESGPTSDLIKSIHEQLISVYGNDMLSGVESYKDIYNLNTRGAVTLYKALSSGGELESASDEEIEGYVNKLTSDDQYQSDSTALTNELNKINGHLSNIGTDLYEIKLWDLGVKAKVAEEADNIVNNVTNITNVYETKEAKEERIKEEKIQNSTVGERVDYSLEGLFNDTEKDNEQKSKLSKYIKDKFSVFTDDWNLKDDETRQKDFEEATEAATLLNGLTSEERNYLNVVNFNGQDFTEKNFLNVLKNSIGDMRENHFAIADNPSEIFEFMDKTATNMHNAGYSYDKIGEFFTKFDDIRAPEYQKQYDLGDGIPVGDRRNDIASNRIATYLQTASEVKPGPNAHSRLESLFEQLITAINKVTNGSLELNMSN